MHQLKSCGGWSVQCDYPNTFDVSYMNYTVCSEKYYVYLIHGMPVCTLL